ncbi:ankyrin repeat domain-containing protein 13B-like [Gigantopelta aegis]|uniref:ankyrin repeat domain-containing protein 13B-like n=1 Tax=Gigantopelta aegis TaxID=1735272 RepID=UPI001B88902A|nr:ankyrin repeat domain-containing protein 13B-like [Gigantopelta aegis]
MASKTVERDFPLHWLVWHNEVEKLDVEIAKNIHDLELVDPRGRTPLMLSVTLGNIESTRVLLRHGANATAENGAYWTVLHESVGTGDPELVQMILQCRDCQRYNKRTVGVPELLQKLKESPDFYVEMKWEFASWVPLVSRMCPSDTYKVWKSGSNVRIDTTLLGFDNMTWQRGSRSYIFKGTAGTATVMEVDHDQKEVYTEVMRLADVTQPLQTTRPSEEAVAARLTSPIVTTFIDTDKISFERNKSGIWGWRSDKTEFVNGYECKVFSASNVELVTKTRTEHLSQQDKEKCKKVIKTPLESFLGVAEEHTKTNSMSNGSITSVSYNPCDISAEDYFNKYVDLEGRDIGRPKEQTTKTQKFRGTLWLCEAFPLSLQEQVIPIIDLMAASNAHFKKLRDFITLQIPAGFPVKIEIPIFHVLNARITFGNIFAMNQPVEMVTCVGEEGKMSCVVNEACFEVPPTYGRLGDAHHERLHDEDDELLQFAIQQSLVDAGSENDQVTFWEALNRTQPSATGFGEDEDRQLQRAIAESLGKMEPAEIIPTDILQPSRSLSEEDQMRLVLEMSQQEQDDAERQRKQEEEELEMILKLSLMEK